MRKAVGYMTKHMPIYLRSISAPAEKPQQRRSGK